MNHRLYRGAIYHQRLEPVGHRFSYPAFFAGLDLDGVAEVNQLHLWGYNRRALCSIRDCDYLTATPEGLAAKARRLMAEPAVRRIELLTVPRVLGYVFNPVSFYLGLDENDRLVAALAEVNNTFHERHVYVLHKPYPESPAGLGFRAAKAFHVSPFNDRRGHYRFRIVRTPNGAEIHVDIERDGRIVFRSGLVGPTSERLTDRATLKALARYPAQNLLTIPRIHFQAARLYFGKKMTYYPKPGPDNIMTIKTAPPTVIEKIGKKVFFELLGNITVGQLSVILPDGSRSVHGPGTHGPFASLHITDYTFFRRILLDGDIGLGEAFMYGQWRSPDVTGFLNFIIANRDALQNGEIASSRVKWLLNRLGHLFHSNTRKQSRKNISAHYDLSNDFFALFLDPTMLYSSACFERPDQTLEDAQRHKMNLLMRRAGIAAGDHVLEIGSGWGALAIAMAKTTGCRVTSVTISREQLKWAREQVKVAGLEDRVNIEFCDYRDLQGLYDKIISVEMLEAVGHEHFDVFFSTLDRLLKAGGKAVLQTITISDERYEAYRKSVDWIQKHIFPGGHLPSVRAIKDSMARCSRLAITSMEDIGIHYAATLRRWSENLAAHRREVEQLGYDEVFYRTWQYYFSYCEAAFATQTLGNMHLTIERPQ